MVLVERIDEFRTAAKLLMVRNPANTRLILKLNKKKREVMLMVTDNKKHIKYRASKKSEFKLLEKLIFSFMNWTLLSADELNGLADKLTVGHKKKMSDDSVVLPRRHC